MAHGLLREFMTEKKKVSSEQWAVGRKKRRRVKKQNQW
jgi:hypothetical protein